MGSFVDRKENGNLSHFRAETKLLARRGCPLLAWYIEHDFITVDRSHHRTLANALTILLSDQTPHIF